MNIPDRIEMVAVSDLKPYERNARTHSPSQVAQIARSIKEFGFTTPILVDGERTVIAGHGRLMAAKEIGLETVPTISVSHLSPAQARAYIIADNKLALNAGWDYELLQFELGELEALGFDVALTGFDDGNLNGEELFGDGLTGAGG